MFLLSVLLAIRVVSSASTSGPEDQAFLASLFGADPKEVTADPSTEDQAFLASLFGADPADVTPDLPSEVSCRCVPAVCCRGEAQTAGVGMIDERSSQSGGRNGRTGLGGGRNECLREDNVCCPPGNIINKTLCTMEEIAAESNGTAVENRCGRRESIARHGSAVAPGQFPWFVTIWEQGVQSRLLGAGALIHPRLVITAAHVVEGLPAASLLVRPGDGGADLTVSEAALHADWYSRARYHDLAVLRLSSAALRSELLPACLGPASLDPGAPFRLSGCQTLQIADEQNATSQRASNVKLLSRTQCEAGLKSTGRLADTFGLHYSFLCARTDAGSESACRTESGSPLTCDDPGRPGRTVLVGLLSWNAACRGLLSWPDVYTRMADVDTFCWLERTVTTMLGEKQPYFGEKLCV